MIALLKSSPVHRIALTPLHVSRITTARRLAAAIAPSETSPSSARIGSIGPTMTRSHSRRIRDHRWRIPDLREQS